MTEIPEKPRRRRSPIFPLLLLFVSIVALFFPWHLLFIPADSTEKNSDTLSLANRYYERRQFQELFRLSASIDPKDPNTPQIYALSGKALIELGNIRDARKALERALDLNVEQPEPLGLLAALYLASGESQKGLALLQLVAKLDPTNFRPWLAMGKVYQDMGELKDAAKAYGEALSRKPPAEEAAQASAGQIQSLIDDNQTTEARQLVDIAIKHGSPSASLLGQASLIYHESGEYDKAGEYAEKAISLNPDEPNALLALARSAILNNKPGNAEEFLLKANRVRPNQQPVLQLLMQAQARQGKTREAAATKSEFQKLSARIVRMDKLTQEINLKPDDPRPRHELGLLALEGNMQVLAEQCFKAALDLDPNFTPAREALEKMSAQSPR